ncbi:MAG: hypothetical protein U1E43_07685 [Rhodospirillales bacterium]
MRDRRLRAAFRRGGINNFFRIGDQYRQEPRLGAARESIVANNRYAVMPATIGAVIPIVAACCIIAARIAEFDRPAGGGRRARIALHEDQHILVRLAQLAGGGELLADPHRQRAYRGHQHRLVVQTQPGPFAGLDRMPGQPVIAAVPAAGIADDDAGEPIGPQERRRGGDDRRQAGAIPIYRLAEPGLAAIATRQRRRLAAVDAPPADYIAEKAAELSPVGRVIVADLIEFVAAGAIEA